MAHAALAANPPPAANGHAAWRGELELGFFQRRGRSLLGFRRHVGPLRVQRPFYPEGPDTCHVYVLHPPGGVVGGDELALKATVGEGARALITTPGAGKAYRGTAPGHVHQHLVATAGGTLEWLPQETIVFDGAHLNMRTRVELEDDAGFIGWDILCLGRPASGERFERGSVHQRIELWRAGEPLLLEHLKANGGDGDMQQAMWGAQGYPVLGSLWCVTNSGGLVEKIRRRLRIKGDGLFSVTNMRGVIVCRYLGASTAEARALFTKAWTLLRPEVMGKKACVPRIWNT